MKNFVVDLARAATIEDSTFEASLDDFYNIHTTVHVAISPISLDSAESGRVWRRQERGQQVLYVIQPRETGTDESVGPEVLEYW